MSPPVARLITEVSVTCSNNIPVPDGILRHAVDGPVELPLFDEKAWAFK